MQPKVFVSRKIPQIAIEKLLPHTELILWEGDTPPSYQEMLKNCRNCHGIISLLSDKIDAKFMDQCPDLKVISNFAVGYDNIDISAASERKIAVGNTPGVLTDATADLTFALLLSAARLTYNAQKQIESGDWKSWDPLGHLGQDLKEKTLGIYGMGRIGYAVAKRAYGGWNMSIQYHSNSNNNLADLKLKANRVSFEELLSTSDIISVHAPLNAASAEQFNASSFARMKSNAIFINTARGGIHNTDDLSEALRTNTIFAAGIDVNDPEPIPANHPILEMPNFIMTPHIGSATISTRDRMAKIAAINLLAGLRSEALLAWVNQEAFNSLDTNY